MTMIILMKKQIQGTSGPIPLVEWIAPFHQDDDKDLYNNPDREVMLPNVEGGLLLEGRFSIDICCTFKSILTDEKLDFIPTTQKSSQNEQELCSQSSEGLL
jgi:hypothetical protein